MEKERKSSLGLKDSVVFLVPEPGSGAWPGLTQGSLWPLISHLWPFSHQGRSHRNISFYYVAMREEGFSVSNNSWSSDLEQAGVEKERIGGGLYGPFQFKPF